VLRAHYIDPPTLPERAADMARVTFDLPPIAPYQPGQFGSHFTKAQKAATHRRAAAKRALRSNRPA
jgi:hypothetical protein